MSLAKKELIRLVKKYNRGKATPQEVVFLEKYYQYFDREPAISETLTNEEKQQLSTEIFAGIQQKIKETLVIPFYKRTWFRAAAASVLIFFAGSVYFILRDNNEKPITKIEPQETRFKNDVAAPMKAKATITLADGSIVPLDSVTYGKLATQGNVNVMMTADGKIVYKELQQSEGQMQYNTLNNPRGSKVIDMQLSDGSHVWLNAGSSVTYPVAFIGKERNVSISGEAYFEVARNTAMPFKVTKGEMAVTVLGTHFNVNAYDDEANIKVTLLEGSVRINALAPTPSERAGGEVVLKPGHQAQVSNQANQKIKQITVQTNVDLDEVMAWKNGVFKFKDASIELLMRQVEKWYDVEIVYEGKIKDHFVATIPRTVTVANVFRILEETGGVHFKIDGKKVTVMP
ncbi:MAG TPA: FecR domain-containing protein [Ferruginibacter sp.]|nr:FecR domain-containing protein [Ferruginibacter sp.]